MIKTSLDVMQNGGLMRSFASEAVARLPALGLQAEGISYSVVPDQRSPGDVVSVLFHVITRNRNFYGNPYSNKIRIAMLENLYGNLYDLTGTAFPDARTWLDVKPRLVMPYEDVQVSDRPNYDSGFVDVTQDNELRILTFAQAIDSGLIQPGSEMERVSKRYGNDHIISHGRSIISPDIINVTALEVLVGALNVDSVLEIGAGVGISGSVMQEYGGTIAFVDLNEQVIGFLQGKFPEYQSTQADAFEYKIGSRYGAISVGLPYELLPWFFERKGAQLAESTDIIVVQSGLPGLFQFEHDWIAGDKTYHPWPWWNPMQTVQQYFPYPIEVSISYQLGMIASKKPLDIQDALIAAGFTPPDYHFLKV